MERLEAGGGKCGWGEVTVGRLEVGGGACGWAEAGGGPTDAGTDSCVGCCLSFSCTLRRKRLVSITVRSAE